jgi:hypothetical protein
MKKTFLAVMITFIAFNTQAQKVKASKTGVGIQVGYNYILSSQKNNTKAGNTIFAGNGNEIAMDFIIASNGTTENSNTRKRRPRYLNMVPRGGCILRPSISFGSSSTSNANEYASTFVKTPFTYKIDGITKNWQEIGFMVGPSVMFPSGFLISATAGAAYNFSRKITINKYDNQTFVSTVFQQETKTVTFNWQANVVYYVPVSNKFSVGLQLGYSKNGGKGGVVIPLQARAGGPKIKIKDIRTDNQGNPI